MDVGLDDSEGEVVTDAELVDDSESLAVGDAVRESVMDFVTVRDKLIEEVGVRVAEDVNDGDFDNDGLTVGV